MYGRTWRPPATKRSPLHPRALERLRPHLGIDHAGEVVGLREISGPDQLALQPFELVHRDWHRRVDAGVASRRFLEDEFRSRIVRLHAGDLAGDADLFLGIGERVAIALHLRGEETDGVLAPRRDQFAG